MVITFNYNKQTKEINITSSYGDEIEFSFLENNIDNDNELNVRFSFPENLFEDRFLQNNQPEYDPTIEI